MEKELKTKIKEFVEIAKECPDNLQSICFEVLLKNFLQSIKPPEQKDKPNDKEAQKENINREKENQQEDLEEKDIHIKARKFLQSYTLSLDNLNQLFYKEGDNILPLYEDLKTTKISESQIRISLLYALLNAIIKGEFEFDGEIVRQKCIEGKCYDVYNYAAIFKTNSNLFDKFKTYGKKSPIISLSNEGKQKLASLIKELQ